jgi:glycosyltransferase involved in cell wall biosynthesis
MRIAQIVPSLEPRHGGPSVSVPALATALAQQGHSVNVLSTGPKPLPPLVQGNLAVQVFARGRPEAICPSTELRAHLQTLDADVLHSHGLWLRPLHYVHERARAAGTRHVISPRGMMSPWAWNHHRLQKWFAGKLIHPGALRAASGWHATSDAEAADIRELGFTQPICIAPNGVEAPAPASLEQASAFWRQNCPEAFARPTALFYSRFHPKKRLLELIDLWLEQAPRDWLLLVVGVPETYSVDQLTSYVHRASGADRVRVFDGSASPAPYVAASVFLLPSHSENFGLVIAEALAHGLPVVVTDTTPWETLNAAGHGWCVPWRQFGPTMLAALERGPAGLREQGAAARDWVLREYSWTRSAGLLATFYRQLGDSPK